MSKIIHWIQKIKSYIVRALGEDPVRPWTLFKHCIGVVVYRFLYGTSISDYFEMRFFERSREEKETLFTLYEAMDFINHINGAENNAEFRNKIYMYQVLGKFTKREQLILPADDYPTFEAFLRRHPVVLYKANAYCGDGVKLWSTASSDIAKLYEKSLERSAVLDELVTQHPDLARLNPDSINTVKIYTFMKIINCR